MTLQAGERCVKKGQSIEVPIYLIRGDNVSNINFEVRYDSSIAELVDDGSAGPLLGGTMFESHRNAPGLVKLGFARTDGLSGTGAVALLTFRAIGRPGQKTVLSLAVTTINHPDRSVPSIDRIDGLIEVLPEEQPWTALDAREALKMSVGTIPENLRLDVDKSGKVTSLDATLILQDVNSR